jgi:hypothetical protein
MSEHRRKTLRSFYCEEPLWQAFEKMARESDVTIDGLLNDSLRAWLNGGSSAAPQPAAAAPTPAAMPSIPSRPATGPLPQAADHATFAMPAIPRRPVTTSQRAVSAPPPPPPSAPMAPVAPAPAPAAPRPTGSMPAARGGMPTLFVHYQGRSYPVAKDRFIIGRGSQGTDLMVRDGNVSRKHAAVIFHGGQFYMQDLGSTNGVEYRGNRVDTKKIEEGDAFFICEHEFQFSYRG